LWIAFGAVVLTLNYYLIANEVINLNVLGFVFSSTLFTYNFQRLLKIHVKINLSGDRVEWIKNHQKFIYCITVFSLIFTIYFSWIFLTSVWVLFFISGGLSFFYVWKVPFLKGKNLRDLPGIKIYLIAFVWVLICVLMPNVIENDFHEVDSILTISIAIFAFIVSITIPFDVRDVNLDELSKKTIPQLLGVNSAVYLSIGLLVLSQILLQLLVPFNFGIWLFTLIGVFVLYQSKFKQPELFFSGIIDGLFIIQIGLLFIFY
jgi:hypothetical protein